MNKYKMMERLLPILYPKFYTIEDKNGNELQENTLHGLKTLRSTGNGSYVFCQCCYIYLHSYRRRYILYNLLRGSAKKKLFLVPYSTVLPIYPTGVFLA